jgi:hypothetical protein
MKHFSFILVIVILLITMLTGADFRTPKENVLIKAGPKGCGYTIIEAGRGINCNGDTIVINKIHPEIAAL